MSRITRVFHIIGIVVAAPVYLLAAALAVYGTLFSQTPNDAGLCQFLALLAALFGFLWYAACRTVAWIVTGRAKS